MGLPRTQRQTRMRAIPSQSSMTVGGIIIPVPRRISATKTSTSPLLTGIFRWRRCGKKKSRSSRVIFKVANRIKEWTVEFRDESVLCAVIVLKDTYYFLCLSPPLCLLPCPCSLAYIDKYWQSCSCTKYPGYFKFHNFTYTVYYIFMLYSIHLYTGTGNV